MADIGMPMSPFEDQKAAKAKLKADKLEYRKKLKEQRKADKEKLHEFAERTAELSGDDAGGLATIVITFFIVLIWLAIMALLIKFNVGNFGSDIMAPLIKDIPVINAILPKEARNDADAKIDEPIDFSTEGSEAGGIQTIDEANAYIKRLEKALQDEMNQNSSYASTIDRLEAEVKRLEPFEQQQKEFYEERAAFYNSIVYNDNAPDPEEYAKYFEQIDPDTAAKIYEKIKRDEGEEAAIKAFATTYSGMKAKQAAKIFDEMVNENQIELVSKILAQMSVENRGDILAQMKEENAAKLTQLLEPNALKGKSTKVTG